MGTDGETKVFLIVAIMLMSFSLVLTMIASESGWLFANTEGYNYVNPPDSWNLQDLGAGDVASQDEKNVTYGSTTFSNLVYDASNITIILSWDAGDNDFIYCWHRAWHQDTILWGHWEYHELFPSPLTQTYVVSKNGSSFWLSDENKDIFDIYTNVAFDNSTYSNLTAAWDDGHIVVYMAFLSNQTYSTMSYNFWDIFAGMISFQSYSIFPYPLNILFGGFFWVSIAVIVLYIVKGWL